jgi:signal transduction histidine kinase
MTYKNFRTNILIRVIVLVGLAIALAYVITQQPTFFLPLAIVTLLIVCVVNLVYYIETFNRRLTHFLLSIKQGAFTGSYTSASSGKPFEELGDAMNDIVREFAALNAEKELHYQYLQTLNEQINVAILSFEADGKLISMNPAAKRMVGYLPFNNIKDFKRVDEKLYHALLEARPHIQQAVPIILDGEQVQLSIQSKEILVQGKQIKIILLQNLSNELEAKEIDAWQQLIRVLTHEIMNSVTPIASLTSAMQTILTMENGSSKKPNELTRENVDDIFDSVNTVSSRAKGLLKFVQAFKELSQPVALNVETVDIVSMLRDVIKLLGPDLQQRNISVEFYHDTSIIPTMGDKGLLEHVFINLLKNAMEASATDGTGIISLYIHKKENETIRITVGDNGHGIDEDVLPKIFIPFFTTKAKGSGIGLSFSRQIIKLHNGSIKVQSTPGEGTVFAIELQSPETEVKIS